jgi:hypothetical protein
MARSAKRSTAKPMTVQPIEHASICPTPMPIFVKPNSKAAPKSDVAANANKAEAAEASRQRALRLQRATLGRRT